MQRVPRSGTPWSHAAVAAAIILVGGCETSSHRPTGSGGASDIAPATGLAADSPMAASEVVQSADFSLQAAQQGFRTEVRNGQLLYCWTNPRLGSLIPATKCLNKTRLRLWMDREQRQRQAMRESTGAACPLHMDCH